MKKLIPIIILGIIVLSCKTDDKKIETPVLKVASAEQLIDELIEMEKMEKLNQEFLQLGTLRKELVDSVAQLPSADYSSFSKMYKSEISEEQRAYLLKRKGEIKVENSLKLIELIKNYGWPSKEELNNRINPIVFLVESPAQVYPKMKEVLLNEVKNGRFDAESFAVYVDDTRKNVLKMPKLYGTGFEFDPVKNAVVPPRIVNVDSTNAARISIGLPALTKGQYRLIE